MRSFAYTLCFRAAALLLALVALLAALSLAAGAAVAGASGIPTLSFVYGDKTFAYSERYIAPTDFMVSEDFQKRDRKSVV